MNKNLIITPTGSNSLYELWMEDKEIINFDIIFLCYEDNDFYMELRKKGLTSYKMKGEKWKMSQDFLLNNPNVIDQYDFFWFPDDDLKISTKSIVRLFELHNYFGLLLSQPSSFGFTSYPITHKQENTLLRFTNFVEIMCPLMSKECLKVLLQTFDMSKSGWGLDYLWIKYLKNPTNKVAIIDDVSIEHTNAVGSNYENRFEISPMDELMLIMNKFNLKFGFTEYGRIPK